MPRNNVWLAIIAGGNGTRLFPISHPKRPKQFCQLDKNNTFIQATVKRYKDCGVLAEHIVIIVTSKGQKELACEQTKELGVLENNIVTVESYYDFAGCMVLAAEIIAEKSLYDPKHTIIINSPADQQIVVSQKFQKALKQGVQNAADQRPTILGVKVTDISTMTGLGHMIYEKNQSQLTKVKSFIEKPTQEKAREMLNMGNTVASTGICIWTADAILNKIASSMIPKEGLKPEVLMKTLLENLDVVLGKFEWYDCGTLKSLYDISEKTSDHQNAIIYGDIERFNCQSSLFYTVDGIKIIASKISDTAVVANVINDKIFVAIVGLEYSQYVKELAQKYDNIKDLLLNDLAIQAKNNFVANINMQGEAYIGFIGKNNVIATIYKQTDGQVVVLLKQTS